MESLLRLLDLDEETMNRVEAFGLAGLIQDLERVFDRARFVTPHSIFSGLVRNDAMELIVSILNKCKEVYVFEKDYTITIGGKDAEKETGC